MSFVRAKEIPKGSGNWYDYEVETIHDKGKVIQRHIQYLGKSGTPHNKPLLGGMSHPDLIGGTASPNIPAQPKVKMVCKLCNSQNTRKYGLYKGIQNYYCGDCHTKFTGTDALSHGRVSPVFIANALSEYYDGMSYHDIENNIEHQTDTDISHTAIMKWVDKYTGEAVSQTKDLQPKVGDTWSLLQN